MSATKQVFLTGVVTTINEPTPHTRILASRLQAVGADLIIVGDKNGPDEFKLPFSEFISFDQQKTLSYQIVPLLPAKSYARKNIGYLEAIRRGAGCIYETDDDNEPNQSWHRRQRYIKVNHVQENGWCNAYRMFTDQTVWPRGFPLEHVRESLETAHGDEAQSVPRDCPIQQGLADVSPDVDAIWRLIFGQILRFEERPSILLDPYCWCPFNSQSTWWWEPAYPLLYLPSGCSGRLADIWRSFVAQRCLWELGCGVVFHAPEVNQHRNTHDLMRDFSDEIPGYLSNVQIVKSLEALKLAPGTLAVAQNVGTCYSALIRCGFLPAWETPLLEAWLSDLYKASAEGSKRYP